MEILLEIKTLNASAVDRFPAEIGISPGACGAPDRVRFHRTRSDTVRNLCTMKIITGGIAPCTAIVPFPGVFLTALSVRPKLFRKENLISAVSVHCSL